MKQFRPILLMLVILLVAQGNAAAYELHFNRGAAIAYAKQFCETPNTQVYDFHKGNDCANFVSQCLVAGELTDNFDSSMCDHYGIPCGTWVAPGSYLGCDGCVDEYGMIIRTVPLPEIR